MDASSTVGMLVVNHPLHGKCRNVDAVENIKKCSGTCQSSTFFDSGNNATLIKFFFCLLQWSQA